MHQEVGIETQPRDRTAFINLVEKKRSDRKIVENIK